MKGGDPISPGAGPTPAPVRRASSSRRGSLNFMLVVAGGLATCAAAVFSFNAAGFIFNATPSLPVGVYRITSLPRHLQDGDMVELCPPSKNPAIRQAIRRRWLLTKPSSPCPDHLVPFIKRIAATSGQHVTLSMAGISVDGNLLPKTAIKRLSKAGRLIVHYPLGRYTVQPGRVWLTDNGSPWAYDSRYWGPVPRGNLLAAARPVLTW